MILIKTANFVKRHQAAGSQPNDDIDDEVKNTIQFHRIWNSKRFCLAEMLKWKLNFNFLQKVIE